MIPIIAPGNPLTWAARHDVRFDTEEPTTCWADTATGSMCFAKGTGRLGLCRQHEHELLGEPQPV